MTLSTWIEAQREASARALADVVSATDLVHERPGLGQRVRPRRGSVLASRHPGLWDPEPDYVHHWVRDAAIVFLAARRIGGNGWPRRMADYVAFSLEIATRPGPPGNPLAASARPDHRRFLRPDAELAALTGDALLGEPRAGADGSADAERWSRPQYDGPALRALSLLRWTGRRDAAMERLLAIDLDHVCRHAARPCIGPWEEEGEDDLHAFTLIAQRIALAEGLGAGLLPEEGARAPLDRIDAALETLWRPGPGHLAARAGSADTDAAVILAALLAGIEGLPRTRIATVTGRFYAMDRDRRWERVEAAWRTIAGIGGGDPGADAEDTAAALAAARARDESDEFVTPTRLDGAPAIGPQDGVFCLNFRADRAREILGALVDPDFDGFERPGWQPPAAALGMVAYSERLSTLMDAMFADQDIPDTLGETVAAAGLTQLRLAETEKYPHVTFFLNGGAEAEQPGERRHMAPSPKVRTYDLAPEMAAAEVAEVLADAIRARTDLVICNFANPDMVGHTGDVEAAIRACEAVDTGLGRALAALEETGGAMLVIADHGNCEVMVDPETRGPHTAHTLNRVPVILVERGAAGRGHALTDGGLADVAPTLLALLGLAQPAAMTGRPLLAGATATAARTGTV
ncbi:MAG: 2,3-bisphosphoglycerate-independent phosphoglycerate mutase [Pseudomonadota bacterium]